MRRRIIAFAGDRSGSSMVEYAILTGLIALAAFASIPTMVDVFIAAYETISAVYRDATP